MIRIIGSLVVLYSWIVAAVLVFALYLIGRFYELKFKKKSYYQLLLIPLALFLLAAGWNAVLALSRPDGPAADFVEGMGANVMLLLGGLGLTGLCYSLYRIMTARKA